MEQYERNNGCGTLEFVQMGMPITDADYNGDIGYHRIRATFNFNGVNFLVEVKSTNTRRTTNSKTGKPLKKHIQTSSNNGIHIEIYGLFDEIIKGCTGKWFMHEYEKTILERCTWNEHDKTRHIKRYLLDCINKELRTDFEDIKIITWEERKSEKQV